MPDPAAHVKRLREMAEHMLYDERSHEIDKWTIESIAAFRAGADAVEWIEQYKQDMGFGIAAGCKP